jgi:hypothetical protein
LGDGGARVGARAGNGRANVPDSEIRVSAVRQVHCA